MPNQTTSATSINRQFIDPKTGLITWEWQQIIRIWQQQLAGGFDPTGNLKSNLLPSIGIVGRNGTIGSILQNIDENGVFLAGGLPAATSTTQGAVILPDGATSNKLGSAASSSSGAFDPAGAAATAQSNAETFASAAAGAAQDNAQAFASNAGNITSGNLPLPQLPTAGQTVTITTAALTPTGSTGSMQFQNGLLIAETQAT